MYSIKLSSSNKVTKKTHHVIMFLMLSALFLISLLFFHAQIQQNEPQSPKLADIVYGNPYHYGSTIYIPENEQYTPYLVFSSEYDNNLLLIRNELTKEPIKYEDTFILEIDN